MRFFRFSTALFFALVPSTVFARVVIVDTGVHTTLPRIVAGIVNVLLMWSSGVAGALFLLGCILMVGSGGSDQMLSAGKRIMKGSLIGLAIVLASWMILSTVVAFISA